MYGKQEESNYSPTVLRVCFILQRARMSHSTKRVTAYWSWRRYIVGPIHYLWLSVSISRRAVDSRQQMRLYVGGWLSVTETFQDHVSHFQQILSNLSKRWLCAILGKLPTETTNWWTIPPAVCLHFVHSAMLMRDLAVPFLCHLISVISFNATTPGITGIMFWEGAWYRRDCNYLHVYMLTVSFNTVLSFRVIFKTRLGFKIQWMICSSFHKDLEVFRNL